MATQLDLDTATLEEERIKALKRYSILDTPPDGSFDKLTKLAASLLKVPIAIVSLVDTDRIWFKSKYGIDAQQIDRDEGLCASVIFSDDLYLVEDASVDPRTLSNPLVAGSFGLRFYAAVPLRTRDGFNLGTFCVIDKAARTLSEEEEQILRDLRDIVMDQIELRLASRVSMAQHNQILNTTAHDLKNPLTTIPVRADLIKMKKSNPEMVDTLCDQIKIASLNMVRIIDELLQVGSMEAGKIHLMLIKVNVSFLVSNVVSMNQPLAERKNQTLHFSYEKDLYVNADEGKLTEIVDNLINNAIKYSPADKHIFIRVKERSGMVSIEVEDQGLGLTQEDKSKLYQRFTRLSAQPTAGENSTGLGLSIVKVLVEAHNGTIRAESEGKDKGCKFIVELPGRNS
ncbi:GAF domain-containing sensor histidine kinase [Pedobacter gandavensis]|uniref:GAF domain-containing sensor histidine kinase n=1 Tax=Pedobacter gandavensis TaxID=2679963 RepID=UPI00247A6EEB|nr:GAF domain-containing sensor histidine kinase [Pedobacter gandavensis]WGQ11449.1 GAF domain-containing sensor histidine kinase [Pedobacter gandavensis]